MSIRQKTINGLSWSIVDTLLKYSLTFIIGIILARILGPEEFGLIGMTAVFFSISNTFINSGFSYSLIQKKEVSQLDLSTVFYFNIFTGAIIYGLLYFSSNFFSHVFSKPVLEPLIKIIGLNLLIGSFGIVHQTVLTRNVNFKLLTKISFISIIVSGCSAIILAYNGFGIWSLVFQAIISTITTNILLWLTARWVPKFAFSFISLSTMFSYGSKLMLSGLLNTIFENVYYLVIGKYFSTQTLGYFTRAQGFANIASENITTTIQRVSFPILSSMQEDPIRLKRAYITLIRSTMFITFISMFCLAASANSVVLTFVGEKWTPTIPILQLICFSVMLYPLHSINLNMLSVIGRSDIFLNLEIIKKVLIIPVVIFGIYFGLRGLLFGMIGHSILAFFINSFYSGQKIGYSTFEQLKDILPSIIISFLVSMVLYFINYFINANSLTILIIQVIVALLLVLSIGEVCKIRDYLLIKKILLEQVTKIIK
jgi:teichuronic acid exporter